MSPKQSKYKTVVDSLALAGFFTSDEGTRVVCASRGGAWGIGGRSFWITERAGNWYVATWAPRMYLVASESEAVSVMLDELRESESLPINDFSEKVKSKYALTEIDIGEFGKLS